MRGAACGRGALFAAILLAAFRPAAVAQEPGGDVHLRIDSATSIGRLVDCGPFADYQQPLTEGGRSSFLSDELLGYEMTEATVSGIHIVPLPGAFLDGMRYWGLSVDNDSLVNCFDDDAVPFNVRFYADGGGAPGGQIGATRIATALRIDTGIPHAFPGLTIQQFEIQFSPPVDNSAETISWIGVQRQLGAPDCLFHWIDETSEQFDDRAFWQGVGQVSTDMTICLALAPVPVELERFSID